LSMAVSPGLSIPLAADASSTMDNTRIYQAF
jgi:hypothetical protein